MRVQRTGLPSFSITASSPGASQIISELFAQAPSDSAAVVALGRNSFNQKLENHLSDYRAGVGYLSGQVGGQALAKGDSLGTELDPRSFTNYNAYTTGLSYTAKARFVNNVADTVARIKKIFA